MEFPQSFQSVKFVTLKFSDGVVFQVKYLEGIEAVESVILNGGQQAVVQIERLQVLSSDESVTFQIGQIVSVEKNFGGVHRKLVRKFSEVGA